MEKDVLIAFLRTPDALQRAKVEHWYHVPVASAEKWVKERWPPKFLAFYQGKVHLHEAYAIHYFAEVLGIEKLSSGAVVSR